MQIFAACSVVAMLLVTTIVGGRLLLAARRTRELPELFFGFGFVGTGIGLGVGQLGYNVLSLHRSPLDDTLSTGILLSMVLGASGAMWLAFFPPAALGSRLELNTDPSS